MDNEKPTTSETGESEKNEIVVFSRKQIFQSCMLSLTRAFGKEAEPAVEAIYWKGLRDLTDKDLARAFDEVLKVSKRFPTIAEIRQAMPATLRTVSRSTERCDSCQGNGWVFVNEHWTYPVGSTFHDKHNRQYKREFHNRADVGKRWTDEERMLNHEIREAVIPCQCRGIA